MVALQEGGGGTGGIQIPVSATAITTFVLHSIAATAHVYVGPAAPTITVARRGERGGGEGGGGKLMVHVVCGMLE